MKKNKYEIEMTIIKNVHFKLLKNYYLIKIIEDLKKYLMIHKTIKKYNIIAEIKKESPSAGEIIKNYVPEDIAKEYEKSGAGAISILTDKVLFLKEI